jgi:RNA polymerase sigma-70 factor (ECF subfamily)
VSARGSHISLPEVPGASASEAPGLPALSVAPPSFDTVYRAHAKAVSRWASRLLGPGGDCEDVVQEVFIVVRHKLPRFEGPAEITTWLYEITVRVVQDWRRRRRWWWWATGRGPSPSRGHPHAPPSPKEEGTHDPVARLEGRERARLFYRVLEGLGEAYRTTFILFEVEGLSGERIAELTGTRLGTVWVRLTRARRTFIDRMRQLEERERREQQPQPGPKGRP